MTRRIVALAGLGLSIGLVGCSLDGTWRTVRTEPADAMQNDPFQVVTFSDGTYSATGTGHDGGEQTSTGTFTWNGMMLTITPEGEDAEPRKYPGSYNSFTGELKLTHEHGDQKVTAYLEKDEETGSAG
jgi:hypothetical protein